MQDTQYSAHDNVLGFYWTNKAFFSGQEMFSWKDSLDLLAALSTSGDSYFEDGWF